MKNLKLRAAIWEKGLTQKAVAEATDIPPELLAFNSPVNRLTEAVETPLIAPLVVV